MNKATTGELNALHGLVAKTLSSNLDDPKVLAHAIKFLKDNDITAEIMESESMMSLTDSIKKIADSALSDAASSYSVEDMLNKV